MKVGHQEDHLVGEVQRKAGSRGNLEQAMCGLRSSDKVWVVGAEGRQQMDGRIIVKY